MTSGVISVVTFNQLASPRWLKSRASREKQIKMLEILAAGFKETGISMFLGSAIVGAVIGWGFKRFNLIYLAIHQVCLCSLFM